MGMYTELHFNAELRRDVPPEVLAVLRYMVDRGEEPSVLPDHPLFACQRWNSMLLLDSYYFDAKAHSTLTWDETADAYYLCVRCNLKNYDGEIEHFVAWVMPYLAKDPGDFLGFSRYEETETPTLIYMEDSHG